MKKITALLVSLIMSCAVMAGCSDSSSSSSSKADSTSKAETSTAADESTTSEAGTATDLEDTLTAQYTKKIQAEACSLLSSFILHPTFRSCCAHFYRTP